MKVNANARRKCQVEVRGNGRVRVAEAGSAEGRKEAGDCSFTVMITLGILFTFKK